MFTSHDVDLAYGFADDVALFRRQSSGSRGGGPRPFCPMLMKQAHLRLPLILVLGLKARACGLLSDEAALPRSRRDLELLLEQAAAKIERRYV